MRYLLYFLYLEWNWGFRLANFIIRQEISGEKKYGIHTIGIDNLPGAVSVEDRKHFSMYEPLNYYTSSRLFNYLQPADFTTTFLDVGCGKGRLLAMGAAYGFSDIIGIDFSKKLCDDAANVCNGIKTKYPDVSITIECADARHYRIPETVGVLFLFNPFDEVVMHEFIKKVSESLDRKNRPLKILYANPQCKQQWLDAGFKETASFVKMRYLQGSVLERK
ncbi:MAG TPA: class I SAM-dependent methyltransferase [Puia sp.]|nr:class I SAM-dependent methyltransferase [Puia sp.]